MKKEADMQKKEEKKGAECLVNVMVVALITLVYLVLDKKIFGKN